MNGNKLFKVLAIIFIIIATVGTINFFTKLVLGIDFCFFTMTSLSWLMDNHSWVIHVLGIGTMCSFVLATACLSVLPDK